MKITDVTPQKNKNRLNIYVDNKFYCGMEAEVFVSSRLKIGNDVTIEKMQELALISDREVAKNKALNYISKRCKSVKEVREYLSKKGYLENVVDNVINFLTDYGYLNDEEYQKMFINSNKYKGKKAIKYKLLQKNDEISLLEVEIENGKMHQIRAHLSSHKLPILGDDKYGDTKINKLYKQKSQCLMAYKIKFSIENNKLKYLNNIKFEVDDFSHFLNFFHNKGV